MATKKVNPFMGKESKKEERMEAMPAFMKKKMSGEKKYAKGGAVMRGAGAATKGKNFKSGC